MRFVVIRCRSSSDGFSTHLPSIKEQGSSISGLLLALGKQFFGKLLDDCMSTRAMRPPLGAVRCDEDIQDVETGEWNQWVLIDPGSWY